MSRCIPDKNRIVSFKMLYLFIKKPVIGGKTGQKYQLCFILFCGFIHPIVYIAAWRHIGALNHS